MLGFTCNPHSILPRVLIQEVTVGDQVLLNLYTLPTLRLDASHSFLALAKLFVAFISVVNTATY